MSFFKRFTHCLKCSSFRDCKRRFDPGVKPIQRFTATPEGNMIFKQTIYCVNPP